MNWSLFLLALGAIAMPGPRPCGGGTVAAPAAAELDAWPTDFTAWTSTADFAAGTATSGVVPAGDRTDGGTGRGGLTLPPGTATPGGGPATPGVVPAGDRTDGGTGRGGLTLPPGTATPGGGPATPGVVPAGDRTDGGIGDGTGRGGLTLAAGGVPGGLATPAGDGALTLAHDTAAPGVRPAGDGALTLAPGTTEGSWTSPWHSTPSPFTETVPSWQASTPGASWLSVGLQVRTAGAESHWYTMANWAFGSETIERETVGTQADPIGRIVWDTFRSYDSAPGGRPIAFRLRATLHGDGTDAPTLRQLASTSSAPPGTLPPVSRPISAKPVELRVPAYSQMTHAGEYPRYGGGGEVWCSPSSTAMVLSYWGTGPTAADIAGLPKDKVFDRNGRVDGQVDWAALHVWDHGRDGAGNWPFNTAYASAYGLDTSVREYSSLQDVERWIRAGVPVVISINWNNTDPDTTNDLDGAAIPSSNGHLLVAIGITASGDVIAADPAAASNAEVRRIYRRDQFERNWLRASNGATYIIKPMA